MRKLLSLLLITLLIVGFGATSLVNAKQTSAPAIEQSPAVNEQSSPIRVGSKLDTEGVLLGYLMLIALEDAGFEVENRVSTGASAVVRDALLNGEIDIYPEYTGTAINNYFNEPQELGWLEITEGASNNAYKSFATVSSLDAALNDVVWLEPAPFNNTFALAVSRDFADSNNVFSVADLADYVNSGNSITLTTSDEFAQRPDGLASFEVTYGFDLSDDQLIVMAGATPKQTQEALVAGNGNIAMAYGTDGTLIGFDLVALTDELGAQPVFQPSPIIRGEVLRANPEIAGILNPIFASLDAETMQTLNARVDVAGESHEAVALDYLETNGFIE